MGITDISVWKDPQHEKHRVSEEKEREREREREREVEGEECMYI